MAVDTVGIASYIGSGGHGASVVVSGDWPASSISVLLSTATSLADFDTVLDTPRAVLL